jgi:hypothetical protein
LGWRSAGTTLAPILRVARLAALFDAFQSELILAFAPGGIRVDVESANPTLSAMFSIIYNQER